MTAFVHAHRHSHHSPDIVVDLLRLKWDDLPTGFVPLSRTGHNTSLFLGERCSGSVIYACISMVESIMTG